MAVTNVQTLPPRRAVKSAARAATSRARPDRVDKSIIAGHFERDTSLALHEAIGIIGRQMHTRLTIQDGLGLALRLFFQKAGLEVPDELKELPRLPCRTAKVRGHNAAAE